MDSMVEHTIQATVFSATAFQFLNVAKKRWQTTTDIQQTKGVSSGNTNLSLAPLQASARIHHPLRDGSLLVTSIFITPVNGQRYNWATGVISPYKLPHLNSIDNCMVLGAQIKMPVSPNYNWFLVPPCDSDLLTNIETSNIDVSRPHESSASGQESAPAFGSVNQQRWLKPYPHDGSMGTDISAGLHENHKTSTIHVDKYTIPLDLIGIRPKEPTKTTAHQAQN